MQKIKQYWKNKHILSYFEVSAKDNINIEFAFEKIVNLKYERFNEINKNEYAIINVYVRKMYEYSSELFKRHHLYDLDKNNSEKFARFCKGKNHCVSLDYFCGSHNALGAPGRPQGECKRDAILFHCLQLLASAYSCKLKPATFCKTKFNFCPFWSGI